MTEIDVGMGRNETLYQMADEFVEFIFKYMKKNNLTFRQFCQKINIDRYYLSKIVDRKIKMYCYKSLLEKIAYKIGATGIPLYKLFWRD